MCSNAHAPTTRVSEILFKLFVLFMCLERLFYVPGWHVTTFMLPLPTGRKWSQQCQQLEFNFIHWDGHSEPFSFILRQGQRLTTQFVCSQCNKNFAWMVWQWAPLLPVAHPTPTPPLPIALSLNVSNNVNTHSTRLWCLLISSFSWQVWGEETVGNVYNIARTLRVGGAARASAESCVHWAPLMFVM